MGRVYTSSGDDYTKIEAQIKEVEQKINATAEIDGQVEDDPQS